MEKLDHIARSSLTQKRKHRRFSLQYPVRLKLDCTDSIVEFEAVSRNISIGGLLLETSSLIPRDTPVSFIVTVRGAEIVRPIQFAGQGKVVRVDARTRQSCFAIAVECARPIAQINAQLPASEN
jgi:PilZ domain